MAQVRITINTNVRRVDVLEKRLRALIKEEADDALQIERMFPATSRDKRLADAKQSLEDAASTIEELKDEMEQWRDNTPESLQGGEKYSEVEQCCDALENMVSSINDVVQEAESVSFPGMF